jgi:hypothetical protein
MKERGELIAEYEDLLFNYLKNFTRKQLIEEYEGYFEGNLNKPYVRKYELFNDIMRTEYSYKLDYSIEELEEEIKSLKKIMLKHNNI